MNYLDIIICVFLIYGLARGLYKGFMIELATLIALILGVWCAYLFSNVVTKWLIDTFDVQGNWVPFASFFGIFVIVVILVNLLGKLLDKLIKAAALGFLNRLLGGILGVLKLALFVGILIFIVEKFDTNTHLIPQKHKDKSLLYYRSYDIVFTVLPYFDMDKLRDLKNKKEKEKPLAV